MSSKIVDFYQKHYDEQGRLLRESRQIELVRTKELMSRCLPSPPARILDVGGGAGIYSAWLAKLGYEVSLIDIVPLHIKQAKDTSSEQPKHPFAATLGDARNLKEKSGFYDVVLLLGPLYHLVKKKDRAQVLSEAWRVLKKNGLLFASAISRYAALLDGMKSEKLDNPVSQKLVKQILKDGKYLPKGHKHFTTAFFHLPSEFSNEISEGSFKLEGLFGIEGPASLLPDSELARRWKSKKLQNQLLYTARIVEQEQGLLGASVHFLAVARKKRPV